MKATIKRPRRGRGDYIKATIKRSGEGNYIKATIKRPRIGGATIKKPRRWDCYEGNNK